MRSIACAVVLLLGASCGAHVKVGRFDLYEEVWTHASTDVKTRAAFELKCPEKDLTLTVLKATMCGWDNEGCAQQIGAEGCGRRLVYVDSPSGWVLNSSDSGEGVGGLKVRGAGDH
jgi:hypothetical protein